VLVPEDKAETLRNIAHTISTKLAKTTCLQNTKNEDSGLQLRLQPGGSVVVAEPINQKGVGSNLPHPILFPSVPEKNT
jgi:hypothetical protein